jgi:hypothetical protein
MWIKNVKLQMFLISTPSVWQVVNILATVTYAVWDRGWAGPGRGLVAFTKISIFAPVRRQSDQ